MENKENSCSSRFDTVSLVPKEARAQKLIKEKWCVFKNKGIQYTSSWRESLGFYGNLSSNVSLWQRSQLPKCQQEAQYGLKQFSLGCHTECSTSGWKERTFKWVRGRSPDLPLLQMTGWWGTATLGVTSGVFLPGAKVRMDLDEITRQTKIKRESENWCYSSATGKWWWNQRHMLWALPCLPPYEIWGPPRPLQHHLV